MIGAAPQLRLSIGNQGRVLADEAEDAAEEVGLAQNVDAGPRGGQLPQRRREIGFQQIGACVVEQRAVLMAGPQVLSMPVGAGATEAAGALSAFVEAGGWVAWGAVPTSAPLGDLAGLYWKALSAQWCELVRNGSDPVLIRHRSLITPECGLALHEVAQAEHVLQLCKRVAECLQDQAVGIRLSAGA